MSEFDRVRDADWAMMLRVSAEVADLPVDAVRRRPHILKSFCSYIGARMAMIFNANEAVEEAGPEAVARSGTMTTVHTSAAQHGIIHACLTQPMIQVTDPVVMAITRKVIQRGTVLREEVAETGSWAKSSYVNNVLRPMGVAEQLSCHVPMKAGGWAGVALFRESKDRLFDERDRQLMALFHRHAGHLYATPTSPLESHLAALPPRLRPVLAPARRRC